MLNARREAGIQREGEGGRRRRLRETGARAFAPLEDGGVRPRLPVTTGADPSGSEEGTAAADVAEPCVCTSRREQRRMCLFRLDMAPKRRSQMVH